MANHYSTKPRPEIVQAAQALEGLDRAALGLRRQHAIAAQDWLTFQACTYALSLLPLPRPPKPAEELKWPWYWAWNPKTSRWQKARIYY